MEKLTGDGTWPFVAYVDGRDIVVIDSIVITCFGGANDPQDNGETASGINTKQHPDYAGCSLPMDMRGMRVSARVHAALDGAPIPMIPFGTLVEVTINGITHSFPVIDRGPCKQASRSGEPHALDLTEAAAAQFPRKRSLATTFKEQGTFRILGGAQYAH